MKKPKIIKVDKQTSFIVENEVVTIHFIDSEKINHIIRLPRFRLEVALMLQEIDIHKRTIKKVK